MLTSTECIKGRRRRTIVSRVPDRPLQRWAWLLVFIIAVPAFAGPPPPGSGDSTHVRLAFISDTQTPLVFERLFLHSDSNIDATRALLHDILRSRPAHVFLLGDLTSAGFRAGSWGPIDTFLDSLHTLGISADAIPGNHELMLSPEVARRNFLLRFPEASLTGYVRTVDSVAVVLLNSNFRRLLPAEVALQQTRYRRAMDSLDSDGAVRAIIVCCHHAPYSNSTVVESSVAVRQNFLPIFTATRKAQLFLSGHAHAFEHFRIAEKDYLVIGGGGGLLHPLEKGAGRLEGDRAPIPRPRFHYIEVQRNGAQLKVTVRALQDDHTSIQSIPTN